MLLPLRKPLGESKMGLTHVAVKLQPVGSENAYNANFLVDTGALDSLAPATELKRIGVKPVGKRLYELASGELQEYEYGIAQVSFLDELTSTDVIFGPD